MDPQQQQMAIIVSQVEGAQFYRLIQNARTKVSVGQLKLAQFQDSKTHFINIDQFCQNIIPGTPFVYIESQTGLSLIFPHIDSGLNGIFIPKSEHLVTFYTALNSVVQMVPFDEAMKIPQFKETIQLHCKDIGTHSLDNPNDAASYIAKGGDYMKIGFEFLGTLLATGINKGGEYLNQKIEPGQEVEVNPETKTKYTSAKEKVGNAFDVTGQFLGQLFRPVAAITKQYTDELGQKIDHSDSNVLKQTKQLTSATWDAAGTALSGLGTALAQVGDSIGKNTKTIVQKKYGNDVLNTYLGPLPDQQQQQQQAAYEPLIEEHQPSDKPAAQP